MAEWILWEPLASCLAQKEHWEGKQWAKGPVISTSQTNDQKLLPLSEGVSLAWGMELVHFLSQVFTAHVTPPLGSPGTQAGQNGAARELLCG